MEPAMQLQRPARPHTFPNIFLRNSPIRFHVLFRCPTAGVSPWSAGSLNWSDVRRGGRAGRWITPESGGADRTEILGVAAHHAQAADQHADREVRFAQGFSPVVR